MNRILTIAKLTASRGGQRILSMLGLVYFTQVLSPQHLGVYFTFLAVVTVLALFSDLGIKGAIEKFVSEEEIPGSVLITGIVLRIGTFLPLCIVLVVFRGYVDNYVGGHVWPLVIISIGAVEFADLTIMVLRAEKRVDETAILEFIRQLIIVGVAVVMLQLQFGVQSLFVAYIMGNFGTGILGVFKIKTYPSGFSTEVLSNIVMYSKHNFISTIAGVFHNRADALLIAFFMTPTSVAIYEVAWRVSTVVVLFISPIATTLFPEMSALSGEDKERIKQIVQEAIPYTLIFAVPALFGGIVVGNDLLRLVFGSQYGGGWIVFSLLLLQKVFFAPFTILARSLQAINRPDLVAKGELGGMVANLVGNVVLISQFGIVGAGIATAGAFALDLVLQAHYFNSIYELNVDIKFLRRILTSSIGMAVGVTIMQMNIKIDSLVMLLSVIGIGACLYFISLLSYTPLRRDTIALINRDNL